MAIGRGNLHEMKESRGRPLEYPLHAPGQLFFFTHVDGPLACPIIYRGRVNLYSNEGRGLHRHVTQNSIGNLPPIEW